MNIPTITYNGLSFVCLKSPDEEEILYLNRTFGFSMLNLEDFQYKTQIPKIETYKNYSLVVLDFPYIEPSSLLRPKSQTAKKPDLRSFIPNILNKNMPIPSFFRAPKKKRIRIGEADFFIGKDYLVVLHDERTSQIDEIFRLCETTSSLKKDLMGNGSTYLFYRIADIMVDASLAIINDLTTTIDYIDKQISETRSTSVVEDISVTRRNIVVFQTMIKPALPIFSDLEKKKYPELNGPMEQYWGNIYDHLHKIWDRLEDNREFIEGISESYESLLAVQSNQIIKILTMFTAILLPLTLLASMYGMNIQLPFQDDPNAIFYISGIMALTALVMAIVFKLKEWL